MMQSYLEMFYIIVLHCLMFFVQISEGEPQGCRNLAISMWFRADENAACFWCLQIQYEP